MPLFRQSQLQKHTPKAINLPNLYKNLLNVNNLSATDKINIMKALEKSGYDYATSSKILSGKDLNISKVKELAGHLSKAGLKGFAQNDTNKIVDKYVRKEAIKKKNIAGRRREFMMESLQEDIYKSKTPRLQGSKLPSSKAGRGNVKLGF